MLPKNKHILLRRFIMMGVTVFKSSQTTGEKSIFLMGSTSLSIYGGMSNKISDKRTLTKQPK